MRPRRRQQRRVWRRTLAFTLLLTLPTTLLLFLGGVSSASNPSPPLFQDQKLIEALNWLNARAPRGSVVLSNFEIGNILPAYTDLRAYIGHGPETIGLERKRAEYTQFITAGLPETPQSWPGDPIRYLILPSDTPWTLNRLPPWDSYTKLYENGYAIYELP